MFKLLKKRLKNEKGLSLVELLAVIVILGIISAIAVPSIGNIIENTRYNAVKADAINVINAANIYYTDTNETTEVSVQKLLDEKYLDAVGSIPLASTVSYTSPRGLTATGIVYSGEKTVSFSGATIDGINADPNKGSGTGGYTISTVSN